MHQPRRKDPLLVMNCERCDADFRKTSSTMSRFNTEMICSDCATLERAHPSYPEAERVELEAVRAGNMNFPGIGCPPELYLQPQKKSSALLPGVLPKNTEYGW